ncbi:molecular chaperone HtpG [Huintestinicola butyrica]|uniref:molecular chaperone HtpG n=1 Tax=Huintestinicola butyrica TaxID=2981728 RepID=UPI0003389AB3|nr:molecular chaperone HtpG [Huintestinicola butyrica]MCU6726928.1 molecular chaperone HtpG [Huintestinicola butyrica]MEE0274200.1 molecular chaperone HtpG [Oscillospiraceae bacterium]CDE79416.1 chaperone protein HtpG [Ruminococcus sp. CAG:353]SCI65036.1 High temperature protein G [uncultured Ruminococcus sp.]
MAETKQFKAESKRLLDMMINSIYTHKEIFLRELISNASDAIDKLYFKSLTDDKVGMNKDDFKIEITADKENKVLTISDNGIGMTADELENNLGIIANSGSFKFKNENEKTDDVDIIGQFGVGFYSAFMVAKEVEVRSKAYGSDKAYMWKSSGADGYTIEECDKDSVGTEIRLTLKDDTETECYDEYLEASTIKELVKKYSDYIRFPIKMDVEKTKRKADAKEDDYSDDAYETVIENETLNSMVPLWRKNKNELKPEDYNNFYKEKFFDYTDPLKYIHSKIEGTVTYDSLLFIPARAPFNFYSKDYEKGLQLYSSGVLISDKCADLLPDYFSFVRGLVDSADLSLNISREMLQHDHQLKTIAKSIEKTIKSELKKMLNNEREKYEQFWKTFGIQIKFGVYDNYGRDKDAVEDLLMFTSSHENKLTTLDEYVSRMKEEQKYIYYAAGDSVEKIQALPQTELLRDKGYEILYLTDNVDEFAVKVLMRHGDKEFRNVSEGDLGIDTEAEKEETKKLAEENKDMLSFITAALDGKVKETKISDKLKSHPVCISSSGQISLEMEKILNQNPQNEKVKSEKVLEINPNHKIFAAMQKLYGEDKEKFKDYASILYDQALLIEGMQIEDPVEFSNKICALMAE